MSKYSRKKKRYNFSNEINEIINKISFIPYNAQVLGSAAIRSNIHINDYDLYEIVTMNTIDFIINRFKNMVKELLKDNNIIITDIKSGEVKEWRIIEDKAMYIDGRVINYSYDKSKRKVEELYKNDIIDEQEYKYYNSLLKEKPQ